MKNTLVIFTESFSESLDLIKRDSRLMILSALPILIGILIYLFLGNWFFSHIVSPASNWIQVQIETSGISRFVTGILYTFSFLFILVVTNFSFILLVGLIAVPFNDLITARVSKHFAMEKKGELNSSLFKKIKSILWMVFNEAKKIALIVVLSSLGFAFSFIPFLVPVSLLFSAILMAVNFLDYSWSRRDLSFRECLRDLKGASFLYALSGGVFLALLSVPLLNLFAYPYAVIYFAVLFIKNAKRPQESGPTSL